LDDCRVRRRRGQRPHREQVGSAPPALLTQPFPQIGSQPFDTRVPHLLPVQDQPADPPVQADQLAIGHPHGPLPGRHHVGFHLVEQIQVAVGQQFGPHRITISSSQRPAA